MTDTQQFIIIGLASFCAGICSVSLWQSWRALRSLKRKLPGFVQLSPHVYVPANQVTVRIPSPTAISTGYRSHRDTPAAYTAGRKASADRRKTESHIDYGYGTASSRGVHMTAVESPWRSNGMPYIDVKEDK